jgi:hypothetical protein
MKKFAAGANGSPRKKRGVIGPIFSLEETPRAAGSSRNFTKI